MDNLEILPQQHPEQQPLHLMEFDDSSKILTIIYMQPTTITEEFFISRKVQLQQQEFMDKQILQQAR